MICAACGMLLIPLWIFAPGTTLLIIGGFLMQFMVQGAWGVVPVHLNELSPPEFRGTFPGLAYQLGNCAAAYAAQQQAWLAERFRDANGNANYGKTMAVVELAVFLAIIFLAAIGRELLQKQKDEGIKRKLVGFDVTDRGIARDGRIPVPTRPTPSWCSCWWRCAVGVRVGARRSY